MLTLLPSIVVVLCSIFYNHSLMGRMGDLEVMTCEAQSSGHQLMGWMGRTVVSVDGLQMCCGVEGGGGECKPSPCSAMT